MPQFTKCEHCGYFTLTFIGVCTNAQCMKPKMESVLGDDKNPGCDDPSCPCHVEGP